MLLLKENDTSRDAIEQNRIPVRNVWLLFLYASGLAKFRGRFNAEVEESPNFKSLIARLLCHVTARRLRRNLTFGFQARQDELHRIRGRIDILKTVSEDLIHKGKVACRFQELTVNTPRNRLIRAAHSKLASVELEAGLSQRCRMIAHLLSRMGIGSELPSPAEIASDYIARHESEDQMLVSLANAVFNVILPTEESGTRSLLAAQREVTDFPSLFEIAIGNFYGAELPAEDGWRVFRSKRHEWPIASGSSNIKTYVPTMETDIVIENAQLQHRIVIDTKFKQILTRSRFGKFRFRRDDIFQLYAYLRSQEKLSDPMSMSADGILLYPSNGLQIDETGLIQGHSMRFVTVDLDSRSSDVVNQLRSIPLANSLGNANAPVLRFVD